jgi:HEAT repeat protein
MLSASALGELGNPEAVRPLIAALADGDRLVRDAAEQSLKSLGDSEVNGPMVDALRECSRSRLARWGG